MRVKKQVQLTNKLRVLVFPCGSENAAEIYQALRYSIHVEIFGASSVDDHGRFRFEKYIGGLPNIKDTGFDSAFSELIGALDIDIVFATHDTVAEYLAPRASCMHFFLINGDPEATTVARRKTLTYNLFSDRAWVPVVYDDIASVDHWPVVVKPDQGQGAQGVSVVENEISARYALAQIDEPLLVEYLPGDELTVDCFTDRQRRLLWVGPRTRSRVKAGITMRSRHLAVDETIQTIAAEINERLQLRGPWFFQVKRDRYGKWKLLEISCRVGGAMVAQRARGINLPLMAIQDFLERDLQTLPERRVALIERNIATRVELNYEFDTVFVDFDDTLVIGGFVTPMVIAFLYQAIRDGKQIKLITRHEGDIRQMLRQTRIGTELFDEIIHLKEGQPKSDYITDKAIFIDNHFPERLEISRKAGIPVFDVDAVEFLLR